MRWVALPVLKKADTDQGKDRSRNHCSEPRSGIHIISASHGRIYQDRSRDTYDNDRNKDDDFLGSVHSGQLINATEATRKLVELHFHLWAGSRSS